MSRRIMNRPIVDRSAVDKERQHDEDAEGVTKLRGGHGASVTQAPIPCTGDWADRRRRLDIAIGTAADTEVDCA